MPSTPDCLDILNRGRSAGNNWVGPRLPASRGAGVVSLNAPEGGFA
jgi:hypothetical protein